MLRVERRAFGSWLFVGFVLLSSGCGPSLKRAAVPDEAVEREREKQRELAFSILMQRRDRLLDVSYPLLVAGAELCGKDVIRAFGFELHNKKLYEKSLGKDYVPVAARYYHMGDGVFVRYVHPKLPAGSSGLQSNDRMLSVNGQQVDRKDAVGVMKMVSDVGRKEGQSLSLWIDRKGETREVSMSGVSACEYRVQLANDDQVNAMADGSAVAVTTGMMRFADKDEELALILGHEVAHNALGHITKLQANTLLGTIVDLAIIITTGVDTRGLFGGLAGLVFSQEFEFEADYAGLYIAARAGYDVSDAANVWRRIAVEHPGSIKRGFLATHPSTPERFVALENTVQEIEEKKQQGKPLLPDKRD